MIKAQILVVEDQAATATLDAAAERLQPDTDGV